MTKNNNISENNENKIQDNKTYIEKMNNLLKDID